MNYFIKFLLSVLFISTYLMFQPAELCAQMFSIDDTDQPRERRLGSFTMVGASWEFADFSYAGEGASDFERVDFSGNILRFRLDSPGLDLSFGIGGDLTGMDDNSYLNVGGRLYNNFAIKRSRSFLLAIPIQLTSDLKQVQQNRSDAEFLQSSLTIGSGLATLFKIGDAVSFNIKATPNYGFSFSQGNLFGGNLFRVDGKGLLFFHNVFGSNSLSLGYHFDYREYRIEGNLNDYDYTSHSVTIGYAF